MGKTKMPRTLHGWLKVREFEPVTTERADVEDTIVELPKDAEKLRKLLIQAQNALVHYTAEIDRISTAMDELMQETGGRYVRNLDE